MWLINTGTFGLENVCDPEGFQYAILSHTWEKDEVTFRDMENLELARTKAGFAKIERTCQIARSRGLQYAWVDTCCIDKSSSAELTEAINSMFRFYKLSAICFAYLSDLPGENAADHFLLCRWFTRGWTLQELVASSLIDFHDQEWNFVGDKVSLQYWLSQITNIDISVLANSDLISQISVAKRMSWAANRCTTRVEDLSYCLFGIFDVNLPLIYGEGQRAFVRLQEAIAREKNDLSLFAWSPQEPTQFALSNYLNHKGEPPRLNHCQLIWGIFATSPSEFSGCGNIERINNPSVPSKEFTMTNKGFHIFTRLGVGNGEYLMDLRCRDSRSGLDQVVPLLKISDGYVRHDYPPGYYGEPTFETQSPNQEVSVYIPKLINHSDSRIMQNRSTHRFGIDVLGIGTGCRIQMRPEHLWDTTRSCFITDGEDQFTALVNMQFDEGGNSSRAKNLECMVFFGLNPGSHDYLHLGYTNDGPRDRLQPWAAIYQSKTDGEISRILEQEEPRGFLHMISSITTALRGRPSLPSTLALQSGDTTSQQFINISLATTKRSSGSLNSRRYNLVIDIERSYRYLAFPGDSQAIGGIPHQN